MSDGIDRHVAMKNFCGDSVFSVGAKISHFLKGTRRPNFINHTETWRVLEKSLTYHPEAPEDSAWTQTIVRLE